ncbi:F0F1 ATP synthase subunit B [Oceanibium sediminis]|uniref:F0F1 ATP synthase subunit B n=1 Tax=Oceanibium sediminis TaxID=2026339 RepID=UPI001E35E54E|nr:F0F1 ATP synthase subunit B [Oceanibium sediminis]
MMILPMATGPFFSLNNTDFVVLLGFLLFIGVILYFKIPAMVGGMLDRRAESIRLELDEARTLREEAQTLLASFERKQKEVSDQAAGIISAAKAEADTALELAKEDLQETIARRLQAATDQIASAEQAAVREVKDRAVTVAVRAAADVISQKIDAGKADALIDEAISSVKGKLH